MRFTFLERGDPAEVRPIILSVLLFLLRRSSWRTLLEVVDGFGVSASCDGR